MCAPFPSLCFSCWLHVLYACWRVYKRDRAFRPRVHQQSVKCFPVRAPARSSLAQLPNLSVTVNQPVRILEAEEPRYERSVTDGDERRRTEPSGIGADDGDDRRSEEHVVPSFPGTTFLYTSRPPDGPDVKGRRPSTLLVHSPWALTPNHRLSPESRLASSARLIPSESHKGHPSDAA